MKCPYVCFKRSIEDACKEVNGFCLAVKDGDLQLSESHMYYYQVQAQMHVQAFNGVTSLFGHL